MEKRILIIDDNPLNLNIVGAGLREAGYEVITAKSGEAGLEELKKQDIDLILLELVLPGLDGFGFLGICKSDPATKHIPVIVLTDRSSEKDIEAAKKLGAMDCLIRYRMPLLQLKDYIGTILKPKED